MNTVVGPGLGTDGGSLAARHSCATPSRRYAEHPCCVACTSSCNQLTKPPIEEHMLRMYIVGRCWLLLVVVGCCWLLLVVVGRCWLLLVVGGCCGLLLLVVFLFLARGGWATQLFMAMAMPDPPKATTRSRTPMSKTSASNASLGSPRTSAQGASPYSSPSCSANSSCTPSDTDSSAARPSSTSSSLGEGAPPKLGSSCCSCSACGAICKSS